MNTDRTSSDLDQLLLATAEVDPVGSDVFVAARSAVLVEAQTTTARAAKVVRLRRRHRRLTVGIAAAAAAGVVAITVTTAGHNRTPDSPIAQPSRLAQGPSERAPVEPRFTTVAQVVNAAATASTSIDPTSSPYWKVVTSWDCSDLADAAGVDRPSGSTCQNTMWTGNGRPGVLEDINGQTMQVPQGTIDIDGRTLTWKQANSQTWTAAQIATMVADNADGPKSDRAPSGYYVFKNAIGLLTYTPASPTIRKQLWQQLAKVPGVTFDGRATDALGRSGWRLTWGSQETGKESIIIDIKTGMPLEESDQGPGVKVPNVTTIASVGPADSAPAAPSARELREQKLAQARACGVMPDSKSTTPLQVREGRLPQLTKKQQRCLAPGHNTPVPMH